MKKSFLLLVALCAITFVSCEDEGDDKPANVLMPFAVGNTWTYNSERENGESTTVTQTIEKSFTVDGKTGFSYEKEVSTDKSFGLLNTDKNGSLVELHFKDGKYVDQSVLFKIDAKEGEKYKAKMAVFSGDNADYELEETDMTCVKRDTSITVAAGTFNCICYCMTLYDNNTLSNKFYYFYSVNMGMVKNTRYEFPSSDKDSVMMNNITLKSYELK